MENLVIKGMVTATSKKQGKDFKPETPTKTAYLEIKEEDKSKAIGFGLTEYTSKENGKSFFIVKLPKEVSIYVEGVPNQQPEKLDGGIETNNFKTAENKFLNINIIKGHNKGNDFWRLQAIQITDTSDIVEIEQQNPFA